MRTFVAVEGRAICCVRWFVAWFCLVMAILCNGGGAEWPGEAWAAAPEKFDYTIGLGDVLEVQVWKEPELSKKQAVRIDGRISMPLVGDIEVVGKSIEELKKFLEGKLGAFIADPSVSVILETNKSWRYYIIGQIKTPGEFPIDHPITLLQAIARSGGFLEWAKTDKISVVRRKDGKGAIVGFSYDALVKGENLEQNILIQPGDTIIIP